MAIQDILPKSRLTLRYRTEIDGVQEDIELPFRLLITGDFSGEQGGEKDGDKKLDIDERTMFGMNGNNTNAVMKRLNIKYQSNEGPIEINSMESFSPTKVAESFPELEKKLHVRQMLNEVISNLSNNKRYQSTMISILKDENASATLQKTLEAYSEFKLNENGGA